MCFLITGRRQHFCVGTAMCSPAPEPSWILSWSALGTEIYRLPCSLSISRS